MNQSDAPQAISNRQRWLLTGLILGMIAIGLADVATDVADGAPLEHVTIEGVGIAIGIAAIISIWLRNLRLAAKSDALHSELAVAHAEAAAWKAKSADLVKGLGQAIDSQLTVWALSHAEKEVALLILKGLSLKEIGEARGTTERTVRQQAQEIYRKSGLNGRAEFAAFFLEDLLLPLVPQ